MWMKRGATLVMVCAALFYMAGCSCNAEGNKNLRDQLIGGFSTLLQTFSQQYGRSQAT